MTRTPCLMFIWRCALVAVLLHCSIARAAPLTDGPYVTQTADGGWQARWIQGDEAAPKVKQERVSLRSNVTVQAVGDVPAFKVRLRAQDPAAPDEVALASQTPLFVVADTHGQFEILVELLRKHRIIDDSLRWSFGAGHLALLGDVFDRGPHHTEIFWLIYKLEGEAARAGGGVHFVLGNHETMILLGDRRYLHPRYVKVAEALQAPTYSALWNERSLLGRWLRTKASVLKLGDYLCLHGGISRAVVDRKLTLAAMNQTIRHVLDYTEPYTGNNPGLGQLTLLGRATDATAEQRELAGFLATGKLGPLWYRGYFREEAEQGGFPVATDEDVERIRELYGVRAVLVGHTIVSTVSPLYDGKVIAVQVSMQREPGGTPVAEALTIANQRFFRAKIDGSTEPLSAGLPPPALSTLSKSAN